jgi:glucosamine--fructose-6-phosphate aminotransferase (isomerizing)
MGDMSASTALLEGLRNIAYRGYDSCGIAVISDAKISTSKVTGPWEKLADREDDLPMAPIGIAHTRWATHGEPSDMNAHPHSDCRDRFAIVHNGIIENYVELRKTLMREGHEFVSGTDSEVIAHLIERYVQDGDDFGEAVRRTANNLRGAFAFLAIDRTDPDQILGVRQDCPLIVAIQSDGSPFLTSDIAAVAGTCREAVFLDNGQIVSATRAGIQIRSFAGDSLAMETSPIELTAGQAQRDGYEHFMLKEIHEQPYTVQQLLSMRLGSSNETIFPEIDEILPTNVDRIALVACGTASYVCAYGKIVLEEMTGLPVTADVASEFRYRPNSLTDKTLFIVISQSGETADTIASMRVAREVGAPILALVNVVGTTIARESDRVIHTLGGPEAAVPSTKVFVNQLVCIQLIGLHLAARFGRGDDARVLSQATRDLPAAISKALGLESDVRALAEKYRTRESWFAIGRGLDEPLAREAALKLKEVAYIHAESMPAGELKHGPIALIHDGMPVLAIMTQPDLSRKMANGIQEVAARHGAVVVVTTLKEDAVSEVASDILTIPSVSSYCDPIISAVPLQLLSYYAAVLRGASIDYPRNLAKSVTVE